MSDLYFSLGNENNRGTLPSTINKIMEGQLSVGISSKRPDVRSKGKLISGTTYDNWHLTENTSKDARAYLDISDTERIPLNAYFSDYSHFATCIEAISNYNNLKKSYLLGTTGTDTTPIYDTDIFISDTTKGALTSKYLLLNNSLGIGVTSFVTDRAFHVKGNSKLEGISEFATGHLYLTGSAANSSTANTTQIVFGTSTDNHIAISSNANALVLNPDVSTTTNQIVLYLDKVSQIPSGISTGSLVVKGNTTLGDSNTADTFKVNAITTHNGVIYFANGTTYYINNSAQGKLSDLSLTANTSSTSTATGTLRVTGGVGITGNLYMGGLLNVAGNTILGNNFKEDTFKVNATTTYNGPVYFANGTTYYIDESAQGKLYNLSLTANTSSTSTSTGTLKVTGGAGISENVYIGGLLNVAGNTTLGNDNTTDTVTVNATTTYNGIVYFANGTTYYINNSAQGKLSDLSLTADISSISTTTGTLKVTGGVGVSENLYIGGLLNVAGNTILGDDKTKDTVLLNAITTANNSIKYTTEESSKRILYGTVRNSGMKYDYGGHECLMFSSGTYSNSSIQFYTSNRISLNDVSNQWNASDIIPDLHIKNGCVAINYNWLSNTPSYNLYVNGNAYIEDEITLNSYLYLGSYGALGHGTIPSGYCEFASTVLSPRSDSVWLVTKGNPSGSESAGFYCDENTIKFWCPGDETVEFLDSDTSTSKTYIDIKANNITAANDITATNNITANTITSSKIHLTSTQDAALAQNNKPGIIVGTESGLHIEIDNNEIMAKNNTTSSNLSLQYDGGSTTIGGKIILQNVGNETYGSSLPSTGSTGQIFFKLI